MRWYNPKNDGWPKLVVDKPYSEEFGQFRMMPRHIKPQKAFSLAIRRASREIAADLREGSGT